MKYQSVQNTDKIIKEFHIKIFSVIQCTSYFAAFVDVQDGYYLIRCEEEEGSVWFSWLSLQFCPVSFEWE